MPYFRCHIYHIIINIADDATCHYDAVISSFCRYAGALLSRCYFRHFRRLSFSLYLRFSMRRYYLLFRLPPPHHSSHIRNRPMGDQSGTTEYTNLSLYLHSAHLHHPPTHLHTPHPPTHHPPTPPTSNPGGYNAVSSVAAGR